MAEAMTWIRKSPFRQWQDPLDHMLLALSAEAEAAGTPLSDIERKMLAAEAAPERRIPDDLKERVNPLISTILQRERTVDPGTISIGFGDALEWVEPDYPNIAALAEEVITSGGFGGLSQLHGARLIKDRAQLVGWAIALVVALMAIAVAIGFLFGRR
jgi:hypothetical protein